METMAPPGNFFIALALFSDCAGPRYFISIHSITDMDIKTEPKELESAEIDTQFQNTLLTLPGRSSAGVKKFKVQFSEKKLFIQSVCRCICNENSLRILKTLRILQWIGYIWFKKHCYRTLK